METKDLLLIFLAFGIAAFLIASNPTLQYIMGPEIKNVDISSGQTMVQLTDFDAKRRRTRTFDIRLLNLPPDNDGYCYLTVDSVRMAPERGAYYTWEIKNMKLRAPIKNNICYFNDWQLTNPEQASYTLTEYDPYSGSVKISYYTCQEIGDCFYRAVAGGDDIYGVLKINVVQIQPEPVIQEPAPIQTSPEQLEPQPESSFLENIINSIIEFIKGILTWFGVRF